MRSSRRDFCRSLGVGLALPAFAPDAVLSRASPAPDEPIRLDSNENPYGPSPAARQAMAAALAGSGRYPESGPLIAAIAAANGVGESNVLLTVGATEGLGICARRYTRPDAPLVTGAPTYAAIATATEALGHPVIRVPVLASGELDLDAMLERAQGAGLLYLCSPNNPTGTLIPAAELEAAIVRLGSLSPGTAVVVGEAYHEYVESAGYESAVGVALKTPRVVVNRTFSKLYGLAGLRLGYLIGRQDTIKELGSLRVPIGASVPGIAAALAVLADGAERERQRRLNTAGRKEAERFFRARGLRFHAAHANYLFIEIGREVTGFREACQARGLLIGRYYPPASRWVRLTIGTPEEMRRALPLFMAVLEGR